MVNSRFFFTAVLFSLGVLTVPQPHADGDLESQIRELLKDVPLVDGHNDTPWQIRKRVSNNLAAIALDSDLSGLVPPMHTDISRLRAGAIGGQFWSVYVPVTINGPAAVQAVLEQIDVAKRFIASNPETFHLALTADDINNIHGQGKIASLIGMEGGHCINNSLAVLRMMYDLGARYMTLTHSKNTEWADSCTDTPAVGGLSEFGEAVVLEMNRLGMLVDLSHVHSFTMHDVLNVAKAPVIFSHSSVRGVTDHPRNVPDDVLRRLPEKDGIVMVTFVSSFVSAAHQPYADQLREQAEQWTKQHPDDPGKVEQLVYQWIQKNPPENPATLSDVADHIDHIRDSIGVDHIGIGGDYDGTYVLPKGLEDVSTYPALFVELARRGYSESDLKKIAGQNLLRVFRKAESVSRTLQREHGPSESRLDERPLRVQ